MNVSDSERLATDLVKNGHEITMLDNEAEVVLLNTCSVREKAENKLFSRIGELRGKKVKPLIGVAGCVAQLEGESLFQRAAGVDFVIGTRAVSRVSQLLETTVSGGATIDLAERNGQAAQWEVGFGQRSSSVTASVPIIEGCNKFCTYCIVPFARGRERSLSPRLIISQILKLKDEGFREVHLIGQNVNSYRPLNSEDLENWQGATPFAKLLRAVAATGFERIKFTTSFPRDFHTDIIAAIEENENLCNWIHLPVQSGSNKTLRAMRRGHTIEDYRRKVEAIRRSERDISLTTDVIVGFPGETDADFAATVELFEECKFDAAYIFKYSPRAGTPAAELADDVPASVKSARFLELERVYRRRQQESFEACRGRKMQVLVERQSTRSAAALTGHTTCQRVVNFCGTPDKIGKIADVVISEAKSNSLYGEAVGYF